MTATLSAALTQLARLYGVQTAYWDIAGQRQVAAPEVLLEVLGALGAPLGSEADVPTALRARQQALWARGTEPVAVAWDGHARPLKVRRRAASASAPLVCRLELEEGETRHWTVDPPALANGGRRTVEGVDHVVQTLALPADLPSGYHRLVAEAPGLHAETHVISAPRRAFDPPLHGWGLFCPTYALQTERSPGSGDLTDLEAVAGWVGERGGRLVGTLPLLAAFLEEPFEPSPYVPASRLFWNELYVDPARAADLETCPAARALLDAPGYQATRAALRAESLVDYARQAAAQRPVLAALARCFWTGRGPTAESFRRFLAAHPLLDEYARFRATTESRGAPWSAWPAALRAGRLPDGAFDDERRRYHVYAQWLAHQQLDALATASDAAGVELYLDLPLGVHAESYDTWRERALFATGVAGGAPPDAFFSWGQNWGFPPPRPDAMREQGHRYFAACVRQLLDRARVLRIDHILGLHRLFWIPRGREAREGLYVRYPAEEMMAVLSLESHRHQALVVGEDLGLVAPAVRAAMAAHGIAGMYVGPFELSDDPRQALSPVPPAGVASLNTHDLPPFAAWWEGLDVVDRQDLGLLDDAQVAAERADRERRKAALVGTLGVDPTREPGADPTPQPPPRRGEGEMAPTPDPSPAGGGETNSPASSPPGPGGAREGSAVLHDWLTWLAASAARIVLINVEDLWLETAPQNVPGTWRERPNWRRKVRHPLGEWDRRPGLRAALASVDRARRAAAPAPTEQGDRR